MSSKHFTKYAFILIAVPFGAMLCVCLASPRLPWVTYDWCGLSLLISGTILLWLLLFALLKKERGLLLVALLLFPLLPAAGTAWTCGAWRYRMELRETYAKVPKGGNAYNIDLMPEKAAREYARYDHHPRFREMKGGILWTLLFALLCWGGVGAFLLFRRFMPAPAKTGKTE